MLGARHETDNMKTEQPKKNILWVFGAYCVIILSGADSIIPLGIIVPFGVLMLIIHPLKFVEGLMSASLDYLSLGLIFGIASFIMLLIILFKRLSNKTFIKCASAIIICLMISTLCYLANDEFHYISLLSSILFVFSTAFYLRRIIAFWNSMER